jgi:dipeptidase E
LRLLLTSAGVKNVSIRNALVDLLGKPIADSSALCIPTAAYGHPMVGPGVGPWKFISGTSDLPMVDIKTGSTWRGSLRARAFSEI